VERQADRHARMLDIARGLVHRLRAQDHHGAGARFELRLPAARRPAGGVPGL
jgi:hypothetical protein